MEKVAKLTKRRPKVTVNINQKNIKLASLIVLIRRRSLGNSSLVSLLTLILTSLELRLLLPLLLLLPLFEPFLLLWSGLFVTLTLSLGRLNKWQNP